MRLIWLLPVPSLVAGCAGPERLEDGSVAGIGSEDDDRGLGLAISQQAGGIDAVAAGIRRSISIDSVPGIPGNQRVGL
jgi:hypothetical protein